MVNYLTACNFAALSAFNAQAMISRKRRRPCLAPSLRVVETPGVGFRHYAVSFLEIEKSTNGQFSSWLRNFVCS